MLPTIEANMSLRHTKRFRPTTYTKRNWSRSITDVVPGQLNEYILKIGCPGQGPQGAHGLHGLEQWRRIAAKAKCGLARELHPLGMAGHNFRRKATHTVSIDLDDVRLDTGVDESARGVL